MRMNLRRAVVAAVLLVGAGLVPGQPARAAAPTFTLSNTGATGVEVNLGLTSTGTIFFGGWDHIAKSSDNGATWQSSLTPIGVSADRVLIVDRTTNRVFVEDTDLACTIISYSDDLGASWLVNPVACGGGVTDHAKIAVGKRTTLADPTGLLYPNIVYMCANGITHTPCAASIDGGQVFGPGSPSGLALNGGTTSITCAFQGTPVAAPNGTLFQPKTQCGAVVERSANNGLTWANSAVPTGSVGASADAPDLGVTPDGTLYFFFTGADWKPYLSRSFDGGVTWSATPIAVAPGVRSALFPVISGGANGKVGLAFYGTTDNPAGWDGNPGNAPASVQWNLYAATITDAAAAAPTIAPVAITSQPVQIGCLSKLGSCVSNIADYIDAEVGPNGRLYIAYVDGCPATCTTAAQSTSEAGYVAIQTGGDSLL